MVGRYRLVDVFTDRPFAGNQLAVFAEGAGASETLMQQIARELNLSETTFVQSTTGSSYEVRIFTPSQELPFAGHPTLGTAWILRELGLIEGTEVVQRSPAGETIVRFEDDLVWLERPASSGEEVSGEAIAEALGVPPDAIGCDAGMLGGDVRLTPALATAGTLQVMIPIRDVDTLRSLTPTPALAPLSHDGAYLFTPSAPARIRARFFAAGIGIGEDPATGSAAASLGAYLGARLGERAFQISQGLEIGRPSTLRVETDGRSTVRVGGGVVPVGEGTLRIEQD